MVSIRDIYRYLSVICDEGSLKRCHGNTSDFEGIGRPNFQTLQFKLTWQLRSFSSFQRR